MREKKGARTSQCVRACVHVFVKPGLLGNPELKVSSGERVGIIGLIRLLRCCAAK
jgi:hypothetical protein